MQIDLLNLLSKFEAQNDYESGTAFFRTHVPWVAELAYLHIIFKPVDRDTLEHAVVRLEMPPPLRDFLEGQNGAILFSGAVSLYGVHPLGQLLNRKDPFERGTFNIEDENRSCPSVLQHFLVIGGYGFDGSRVCIDRRDLSVHLFQIGSGRLVPTPSYSWKSLEDWITSEVNRLSTIFNNRGERLVDERQTLPHVQANA